MESNKSNSFNDNLLFRYKRDGLNMKISSNPENYNTLDDLTDDEIKKNIKVYSTMGYLGDYFTKYFNTLIYIYNDVLLKKRIEKIKQIKDKINE